LSLILLLAAADRQTVHSTHSTEDSKDSFEFSFCIVQSIETTETKKNHNTNHHKKSSKFTSVLGDSIEIQYNINKEVITTT